MNAGQYEGLMGVLGQILDRMPERPAPAAPAVALTTHHLDGTKTRTLHQEGAEGASLALYSLLVNLDGWIDGARSNHDGFGHSSEAVGSECWTQYHPADIRTMVNDVARELGLGEFPKPSTPREDEVR